MTARYLTAEQDTWVAGQYIGGRSMKNIADELGFSTKAVRNSLVRTKTSFRPRGQYRVDVSPEVLLQMLELHEAGASVTDIMRATKTGRMPVHRALRGAGRVLKDARVGRQSSRWKGGRWRDDSGYWRVWVALDDPYLEVANASGYAMEHRLVMSRAVGRVLGKHETVHHINGDRGDNRIENLQLRQGRHGKGVVHRCVDCGSTNIESTHLQEQTT